MLQVRALATGGPGEPFRRLTIGRRNVGPGDVLIDIAYCGVTGDVRFRFALDIRTIAQDRQSSGAA
jgi:D-arabinose 1-dehydrogenase-like Zn-dependent alcohol dehydrogenase